MGARLSVKENCDTEHESRIRDCARDKDFNLRFMVPDTYSRVRRKAMRKSIKSQFKSCAEESAKKLSDCSKPRSRLSRKQRKQLEWRKKLGLLRDHRDSILRVEGGGQKNVAARRAYNAELMRVAEGLVYN